MKIVNGGITAPKGFLAGGAHCGLRKKIQRNDIAVIYSERECAASAVYTTNKVRGEPLLVTMEHLADGKAKAVVCNSGNANTCTGALGRQNAKRMAEITAAQFGIRPEDVIVASTGVIGVQLDMSLLEAGIPEACARVSRDGYIGAREGIMTTDTVKKDIAVRFEIGGVPVAIAGMAKGSGMIHPNMATMLSFLTTDCAIAQPLLKEALAASVRKTYNMISVDGDTSTNDMCVIMANGAAGNLIIDKKDRRYRQFSEALDFVNTDLAKKIAKDGEGATRLLEARVVGAKNGEEARIVALSIIKSSLVKAAMFGSDANWGRILCAIGYSGADIDPATITVGFESGKGYLKVFDKGEPVPFDEEIAKSILLQNEIAIHVDLGRGGCEAVSWGCDLSYEYVRINGDYRS